jgi:hypothetical protein
MSKVMLYTGYLNYEYFGEPGDNPVAESRVFDVSTPEKLKRAKMYVLREERYGDYLEYPVEPAEPKFSLSELKDTKKVDRATKKYEKEKAQFTKELELFELGEKFFSSGDSIEDLSAEFSADFVDDMFTQLQKFNNENGNGAVTRVYFFETEDAA